MVDSPFGISLGNRVRLPKYAALAASATWDQWDWSDSRPHDASLCQCPVSWQLGPRRSHGSWQLAWHLGLGEKRSEPCTFILAEGGFFSVPISTPQTKTTNHEPSGGTMFITTRQDPHSNLASRRPSPPHQLLFEGWRRKRPLHSRSWF